MDPKQINNHILSLIFAQLQILDLKELEFRLAEARKQASSYEAIGILHGNPTYFNNVDASKTQIKLLQNIITTKKLYEEALQTYSKQDLEGLLKKL